MKRLRGDEDDEERFREEARLASILARLPADQLAAPTTDDDHSDNDLTNAFDQEKLTEAQRANQFRKDLVKFTQITVAGLVIAATVFMLIYVISQWGEIEAGVMIAYFTSIVAEVVGILWVIARYLFPSSGSDGRPSSKAKRSANRRR